MWDGTTQATTASIKQHFMLGCQNLLIHVDFVNVQRGMVSQREYVGVAGNISKGLNF